MSRVLSLQLGNSNAVGAPSGSLAQTGTDAGLLLAVGFALAALGALLLAGTRRRVHAG